MVTSTTRLGLEKPDYADAADIAVLNQNFDDIDNAVGMRVVTSATRPATPWNGQIIFETDTNATLVWDSTGAAWKQIGNAASVCTAATRPASPLNGQIIYETDTRLLYVYSTAASAWRLPIQYFRPANAAGLAAITGMLGGATAYQVDTNVEYLYNGSSWVQVYPYVEYPGTAIQTVSTFRNVVSSSAAAVGAWADITGMSVAITPRNTSSKVLVTFSVNLGNSTAGGSQNFVQLLRGSTAIGVGTGGTLNSTAQTFLTDAGRLETISFTFLDSPASAAAVTYKLQYQTTAGTIYLNRRGTDTLYITGSSITVTEVAG